MELLTFAVVMLWAVVLVQFGVIYVLARQIGVLFERVAPVGAMISHAGPDIGARAPDLLLPNLTGAPFSLGAPGRARLVFFLSTTCPICKSLLPALKSIGRDEAAGLEVILASDGREALHRRLIADQGLDGLRYTLSAELGMTFRISKLPFAVLIGPDGVIRGKGLVNSREQLESLLSASETGLASVQAAARIAA